GRGGSSAERAQFHRGLTVSDLFPVPFSVAGTPVNPSRLVTGGPAAPSAAALNSTTSPFTCAIGAETVAFPGAATDLYLPRRRFSAGRHSRRSQPGRSRRICRLGASAGFKTRRSASVLARSRELASRRLRTSLVTSAQCPQAT